MVLWIALFAGLTFTALELVLAPRLGAPFVVKCVGVSLTTAALVLVRGPWPERHSLFVSLTVVCTAYLLTAISGIVSPSREYETTAVLFVGASLTTATLLPWGVWPQAVTVLFATLLLGIAVEWGDGNLYAVFDDPAAAVVIGLGLSVLTAREVQQHRLAWMRELAARRRAERGVRALNADLERRVAERTTELEAANEQLHALSARIESAREEERSRIAREVHDEFGQMLTALKIDLYLLPTRVAPADEGSAQLLQQKLAALSEMADTMIQSVRRICGELRPSVLDDLGLPAAIEWQAQEFQRRSGVRCTVDCEPQQIVLDDVYSTALFRVVQESLTNVARHAEATKIVITLRKEQDRVTLEVRDDGRGITDAELHSPRSLGLLGIRERARFLGGEADIHRLPGHGTTVRLRIPAPAAA